jgi:hypothetical protein
MLGGTSKSQWDVRNGIYYEGLGPCDIITLTNSKFVYVVTITTLIRYSVSKEEAANY